MSTDLTRVCYRGTKDRPLPAVCSHEYHELLVAQMWEKFIEEVGIQETVDLEGPLTLGNCPLCHTTLSRRATPDDIRRLGDRPANTAFLIILGARD